MCIRDRLSSLKFRTIAISKIHILRTPCPKCCSIMVVLNRKLRVNCEYMMFTLILIEWITSTRWLGHGGICFFGFSMMACSHSQPQEYKKLCFYVISIPNKAWKSFSFFFYLIRNRKYLLFLLFSKHLLNGKETLF